MAVAAVRAGRAAGHVFLSHNAQDKAAVERLARQLLDRGLRPWLDKWEIAAGRSWQQELQSALESSLAVLVCVGEHGLGRVQLPELAAALEAALRDPVRLVVPVLLPGAPAGFEWLPGLRERRCVDLRAGEAAYRELFAALGALQLAPAERVAEHSPFRGLQAFEEQHARWFFGREAVLARLLAALRERRLLVLIGPSGSGKSSLVRAGLLPAVRTGELDQSYAWVPLLLRPGPRPLHELALRLANTLAAPQELAALRAALARSPELLADELDREAVRGAGELRFLVVVDQFEEVFALCRDGAERAAFIAALLHAASAPGGRTHVVWALRSDFLAPLLEQPGVADALHRAQLLLGPPSADELRAAIRRPALLAGLELEAGLEELLVQAAAGEPGDLPLLQVALEELWRQREGTRLTLAAYRRIGGVRGALTRRADAVLAALAAPAREGARRLLGRLVQLGEGAADTRRRLAVRELTASHPELGEPLQALIGARLLTAHEAEVEVAHEALIREWATLRDWIEADRELLRLQQQLERAARLWGESAEAADLWSGGRLAQALELRAAGRITLAAPEQAFLDAALAAVQREAGARREREQRELDAARSLARAQASAARRLRSGLAAAALLALAAAAAAVAARAAQRDAQSALAAVDATLEQAAVVAQRLLDTVDDELYGVVGAAELRQQLLSSGAGMIDRLLAVVGVEQRSRLLHERAGFHRSQSLLASALDDPARARAEAEAELAIQADLAARSPHEPARLLSWANAYHNLAEELRTQGELAAARGLLEQSEAVVARVLQEPLGMLLELNRLGRLGQLELDEGRPAAARRYYERAAEYVPYMSELFGDRMDVASWAGEGLAQLAKSEDRLAEAREFFERSLQRDLERARAKPGDPIPQRSALDGQLELGLLAQRAGDLERAGELYAAALEIGERLVAANPGDGDARARRAQVQVGLGALALVRGELAAARAELARAQAALEPLLQTISSSKVHALLGRTHLELSRVAEAEEDFPAAVHATERSREQELRLQTRADASAIAAAVERTTRRQGQLALQRGALAQARRAADEVLARVEPLAAAFPGAPRAGLYTALALLDVAAVAQAEGRLEAAAELCARALRVLPERGSPEREPEPLLSALAAVHRRQGLLAQAQGRFALAVRELQAALELHGELARSRAGDAGAQRERARAQGELGAVLRESGKGALARSEYERAIALQRQRLGAAPSDERTRLDAARALAELAELEVEQGRRADARALLRDAQQQLEPQLRQTPQPAAALAQRARVQRALGELARSAGDLTDGRRWLERSTAGYRELLVRDPQHGPWLLELARAERGLGAVLAAQGERAARLRAHERALALVRQQVEREPTDFESRRELVAVQLELAAAQRAAGEGDSARVSQEQALATARENLARSPSSAGAQRDERLVRAELAADA